MSNHEKHFILPVKTILIIGGALLVLTWFTVFIAGVHLGAFNFLVAVLVATIKASLVVLFFMGLKYDVAENRVIFITSLIFSAIFMVLTATDIFFRPNISVKESLLNADRGGSKFEKAWISAPALLDQGKELYATQCASCHGVEGRGDGVAAAALKPPPRNFHSGENWTKGRKPSQVFDTITKGISGTGMAAFSTLPSDDRWALTHYVLSLGPSAPSDTVADLKKIGIDPNQEGGGQGTQEQSIPVDLAIEILSEDGKHR